MAPLPCSPVSNSTASEQSTQASDDSDDSLITPRPGPSDPAQRSIANLSRPSLPAHVSAASSYLERSLEQSHTDKRQSSTLHKRASPQGHARSPFTYSPNATTRSDLYLDSSADEPPPLRDRVRSVTFMSQSTPIAHDAGPSEDDEAETHLSLKPPTSSLGGNRFAEETESSADENTGMFRAAQKKSSRPQAYGSVVSEGATSHDQDRDPSATAGERAKVIRRKPSLGRRRPSATQVVQSAQRDASSEAKQHQTWVQRLVDKYGSVELENKGSVARDHLALERTFLAWLRTSLSFASIGIAVTQLFRLNSSLGRNSTDSLSLSTDDEQTSFAGTARLRSVGKPLGATFLGVSILILLLGFQRFFESQHYVIQGKFPASRGSIVLVSLVAGALIVASFVVVIAIAPTALHK